VRRKVKHICAIFIITTCLLASLSGCNSGTDSSTSEKGTSEEVQQASDVVEEMQQSLEFSTRDIEGETYTQDMFADYDLTMVNVFATWCSPCIREIPDLQKLRDEMADQGVNVVGIVLDGVDISGNVDEEAVEKAKILAEETGAVYPFLIPDEEYLNGILFDVEAVPKTFFVDKNGNIVGESYTGSRSLEDWKEIVESELKGITQ
jgi:thiol-disulfide isomerase/thioredoxin